MQGPEDGVKWKTKIEKERRANPNTVCRRCRELILVWHCSNGRCVWCGECGAKARDLREKRKNGEA